jgi:cyclic pyranopterin phosphate synthase
VSDQINDPKNELGFTHLDQNGEARMVDVGPKDSTHRRAVARGKIFMAPTTADAISAQSLKKGDVLGVARIAGIQAAKKTSDIIPLCHPLMLSSISVNFEVCSDHVAIQAEVEVTGPTGVEMEALHACSAAALTIYDMCKAIDKSMIIGEIALWEKTGGKSGPYRREL